MPEAALETWGWHREEHGRGGIGDEAPGAEGRYVRLPARTEYGVDGADGASVFGRKQRGLVSCRRLEESALRCRNAIRRRMRRAEAAGKQVRCAVRCGWHVT